MVVHNPVDIPERGWRWPQMSACMTALCCLSSFCGYSYNLNNMNKTPRRALGGRPKDARTPRSPSRAPGSTPTATSQKTSSVQRPRQNRKKRAKVLDAGSEHDTTLPQLPESGHMEASHSTTRPSGTGLSQPYVEDASDVEDELSRPASERRTSLGEQGGDTSQDTGEGLPKEDTESHKVRRHSWIRRTDGVEVG